MSTVSIALKLECGEESADINRIFGIEKVHIYLLLPLLHKHGAVAKYNFI